MRAVSGMPLLALAVMGLAPSASAQTGVPYYSMEWLVAHADLIVRASIVQTAKQDKTWVVLEVKETFKGAPPSSIRLTFAPYTNPNDFEAMKPRGDRLWFLEEKDGNYAELRGVEGNAHYHIGLSPDEPKSWQGLPLFRMTLRTVDTPEALLDAVRESVRTEPHPAEAKTHSIHMRSELMKRLGRGAGSGLDSLSLPVDARLEKVAQEMIRNPERIGEGADLAEWRRFEGIGALRYFRSEENIALLKPLLEDPTFQTSDEGARYYRVRGYAFAVLQAWGVDVKQPVTEEEKK